jgi:hypothetical protein
MTVATSAFTWRPVEPGADAALLHRWVTHPKAAFWLMQGADVDDVEAEYRRINHARAHEAFIGEVDGVPQVLAERYDPRADPVGKVYDVEPGDIGMHFLCAPTDDPVPGFTRAAIAAVMELVLSDARVTRVVVEPDVRNDAVHRLNAAVGFTVAGEVTLPDGKRALLSFCTRDQFEEATR